MNSRIPLIVAVLLAMFALGFAGSRLVSSVPQPASASARLATSHTGLLPGHLRARGAARLRARSPVSDEWRAGSRTSWATTAAGPQPVRHGVREDASGTRRHPVRPDRSDRYLDQRDRERYLR